MWDTRRNTYVGCPNFVHFDISSIYLRKNLKFSLQNKKTEYNR